MDKENKMNYVVISINDYNSLQCNNINLKDDNTKLKNNIKVFEKYFFDNMLQNEDYKLNHIENFDLEDYYLRALICSFLEYGNFDINYLIDKIKKYKEDLENESKK